MCGIAGVISKNLEQADLSQRGVAMQNALRHRGPDDLGISTIDSESVATCLVHTRLSIIDLSNGGHQPMSSTDHRYTITYNGEIFNYQEIKANLLAQGEQFVSSSDTEVILRLYQLEGENCLNKLRGMFAFFIWDKQSQTGFAARDPLGIKPFYYSDASDNFVFASELRAVTSSGLVSNELSANGLQSYFTRGSVAEPDTILQSVKQLPAGHKLIWRDGEIELQKYAAIEFPSSIKEENLDYNRAIQVTRSGLESSVKAHLVGDVPVGIFLSGGIDSTALLALATQFTNKTINTYSIAFEDPEWNEGDIAKRVANHFGSNHTELVMTREMASSLFNDFLHAIDQPTIDGFNSYCVSKLAHDHGEKVVLSGLGGDELFAGYKSFKLLPKMVRFSRAIGFLASFIRMLSKSVTRLVSPQKRRVLDFLSAPGSMLAAHQSLRGIFSNLEATELLKGHNLVTSIAKPVAFNSSISHLDKVSEIELSTYMRNQLLRDSDVMSMAWGLELRVPFVDYQLLQTVAQIPAKFRLQYGKRLLTDSVPEIPEWVISRPKQGFRFPFDDWFSDNWNKAEINKSIPKWIPLKPWYRSWNLAVLHHWLKHKR